MKVFVNAVSIKEGGSLVVLKRLLDEMRLRPNTYWELAVSPLVAAIFHDEPRTTVWPISVDRSPLHLVGWYECGLPKAVRRTAADVMFSLTNYLPRRRLACPTLLLEQHAGHFSEAFHRLTLEALPSLGARTLWGQKRRWVRRSVRTADVLTVQTAALAEAVISAGGVPPEKVWVIPHGPGWVEQRAAPRLARATDRWRIGYVTKWGVQKNFSTLFRAAGILQAKGVDLRLVLTLDRSGPGAEMLAEAERLGIGTLIENHGETPNEKLQALYDDLDVFVFPSTCESFGMPMVEAMARGLPVVVADTPENREITAEAGLTFAPYDAEALAGVLSGLFSDRMLLFKRSVLSLERGKGYSWVEAGQRTLAALQAAVGVKDG